MTAADPTLDRRGDEHDAAAYPPCAGAADLCGAPAGQPCEPGCPSLAADRSVCTAGWES
ncbi:hypothetical protein [Pseudonocardia sp. UM4_GMWB1]|uniref:hypothetical protein n=1 Tax=Pseudonocardia sp. UM4_GMWB1 TaxID=2212989 RepID=UPI00307E8AFF